MRLRGWWAGAGLLLATGCATEQEEALQEAVDAARDRNAVIGAAIGLLLTLAIRHVRYARAADRAARAQAAGHLPAYRGRGPGPWRVAAAVATEVVCDLVLLAGGSVVGWLCGPKPYDDQPFDGEIAYAVVLVFGLPLLAALAALAMIVQGTAARLPEVGTGTLVFFGALHAALVAYGVSGLFTGSPSGWGALVPAALGLIGAGGCWYDAYARRRARSAALPR